MKKNNTTSYSKLGDFAPKVSSPNNTLMALGVVAVITLGVLAVIGIGESVYQYVIM
jgi:hypothetical protein